MYTPQPINTDEITLPQEMTELVEAMARNVHEEWAAGRIAQGWVYGTERNDKLKTTPCLVPYEELSDEEKEYDRTTAISTLKFIMASGFEITKEIKV